jgi:rod shape-determining protein MreD
MNPGSGPSAALLVRIGVLGVLVVFFQIGVVSEVPVFGVSADLSPLLVAFVGLLCGSTIGAATGFAVGLLLDLALVQTLGVTSLTLTVVGYGAGRLRELRVDSIVALPAWAIVRRSLVGSLPDDPRRRRRRAYTTGGLSPLSRS